MARDAVTMAGQKKSRWMAALCALAVFTYLVVLRTRHITEIFELLGDQILYWDLALRAYRDLPIGGGPSSAGGTTIGPAFIWLIWAIRHVVGPWTENLPHAGGIGISILQSAADACLVVAMWRRFASLPLALAVTLLVATTPEEMSLSASIWNPPVAVAFVKLSIACVLLDQPTGSLWWSAAATGAAVLAVQCHSSAVFFAAPAIAATPVRDFLARRRDRAWKATGVGAAVVLVLETPFLVDRMMHPARQTRPEAVVGSVAFTLAHPESIRPVEAFRALVTACDTILLRPRTIASVAPLLAACATITAFRTRHDIATASATIVPLVASVAGFAFWQRTYEYYWFMTMMPSAALTIGLALTAWRPAAPVLATALLLVVLAAQPQRYDQSLTINRLPEYGAIVRGSKEIRRRTPEIRRIELAFLVPPSTRSDFIYRRILGGRVTPTAAYAATIERSGRVRFTPAR